MLFSVLYDNCYNLCAIKGIEKKNTSKERQEFQKMYFGAETFHEWKPRLYESKRETGNRGLKPPLLPPSHLTKALA